MKRREFLLAATGTAAGATAVVSTPASAQERPDFGGWLDGVDGGFEDARGADTVTVEVGADGNDGAFAFSPAGLWIDPGTTVTWEWTGAGGQHNVHSQDEDGPEFESELTEEEGFTFEYTFEEGGISTYQCDPHASLGMKGAVAVGDDVPTTGGGGGEGGGGDGHGGGGEVDPEHMGVPFHAHWVGVATILAIFISFVFTFFQLKYGETPHSGYPRED